MRVLQRLLACVAWIAGAPLAGGACKLHQVAELPVRVLNNQILAAGEVNGQPVNVLIDTGADHSFMWEGSARRLGLTVQGAGQVTEYGAGGEATPLLTSVKEIRIGSFAGKNMPLAVIASRRDPGARRPAMVLGEDFLSWFDAIEFDLAHGAIRLLRPEDCKPDQVAYWSTTYAVAELHGKSSGVDAPGATMRTQVLLNGQRLDALLDTGAARSIVTRHAAQRAGVTPWVNSPPASYAAGVAGRAFGVWEGTFDSFSIGDETARQVRLRIADLFGADRTVETGSRLALATADFPSMLIGCDFFLSHRLLVLAKERTLVFTYSGGPVFGGRRPPTAPDPAASQPATEPAH